MTRLVLVMPFALIASAAAVSAHVVRGILNPSLATAFVSSPSAAEDAPIALRWGSQDTGLRVACFNVANTSPALAGAPGYPRVTALGLELPGALGGFALVGGTGEWDVLSNVPAPLAGRGAVTLDVVLLARGNGIPPEQAAARGSGTRFCLSGPFPDGLNIEQLINGVAVGFQTQPNGPIVDVGLWDSPQRAVPLFP